MSSTTDLPQKLIQANDSPWCHAGTPWHYKSNGVSVGSFVPDYWREDMVCGLPSPYIREWEMKILFKEGQFKETKKCECCGHHLEEPES